MTKREAGRGRRGRIEERGREVATVEMVGMLLVRRDWVVVAPDHARYTGEGLYAWKTV